MDWLKLVETHGVPTVILFALLYVLIRAGKWMGKNVVVPIKDAHIDMVDSLKKTQETQARTLDRMADTQSEQARLHTANTDDLQALRRNIERELRKRDDDGA